MQNGYGLRAGDTGAGDMSETPAHAGFQADAGQAGGQAAHGLRASLEAIMLVADEPVSEVVIAQVLERPRAEVTDTLRELAASYAAEQRGFDLRQVAGGWRPYTRAARPPIRGRVRPDRRRGPHHPA